MSGLREEERTPIHLCPVLSMRLPTRGAPPFIVFTPYSRRGPFIYFMNRVRNFTPITSYLQLLIYRFLNFLTLLLIDTRHVSISPFHIYHLDPVVLFKMLLPKKQRVKNLILRYGI